MTSAGKSALFDFIDRPSVYKLAVRKIKDYLRPHAERFSFAVLVSAAAHVALCLTWVIGSASRSGSFRPSGPSGDFQAVHEALRELSASPENRLAAARLLSTLTADEYDKALGYGPRIDSRLTTKEKAKILQAVMSEALTKLKERKGHESALDVPLSDLVGGLRDGRKAETVAGFKLFRFDNPAGGGGSQIYGLPEEKGQRLASLLTRKGETVAWTVVSGRVILLNEKGTDIIPEEYFFRKPPYEAMMALGSRLFHVVSGFPQIGQRQEEGAPASSSNAGGTKVPHESEDRSGREHQPGAFKIFFLRSSAAGTFKLASNEPVPDDLTQESRKKILDRLMDLPEADQVAAFFRDYLDKYDPDSPELARLTREFIYENLGMVMILTDPLSGGFDGLEEAFYNKLSMEDFTRYYLGHPRTRTGAEILFCLASYYDFENRAIRHLRESLETAGDVLAGWRENLAVYDKRAKAFVVQEIDRELRRELRGLGLSGLRLVRARYAEEQVGTYRFRTAMGGDIKDRAIYALGAVYWDEGRSDLALAVWKSIDPVFSLTPLDGIRKIMSGTSNTVDLVTRINGALNRAADFDSSEQFDRLSRFHKWARRAAVGE